MIMKLLCKYKEELIVDDTKYLRKTLETLRKLRKSKCRVADKIFQ